MKYQTMTLGTVATYINGRAFKPSEWETQGLPIIRIQNLTDENAKYNYSSAEHEEKYLVKNGDLLFAWSASLGAHIWKKKDAWLNQHIFKVIPNDGIMKMYLYYFLLQVVANLYAKAHGTGMVHITKAPFMATEIPVPPLEEQARIVARIEELFSQLESGVETLKQTKEQLAVYRQAVLKEAFDNEQYPKKKASEVGIVHLGRQRSPKNISKDYPTKYIRAANITESGIDVTNVEVLEMEFTPKEREKYYLQKEDIVLSEASGSATQVGKPAIWNNEISNCCFQNTVIRHRVLEDNPEYILWYYKFLFINGFFSRMVGGVGINHIGASNFSNISIPIPPKEKQAEIVRQLEERLSVCDQIEQTVDAALQQAEALRQSILKKAFERGL